VPLGVYDRPPPDGSSEFLGAMHLGDDEGTTVAGVKAGRLLFETTKAAEWLHRHLIP
jgi:hypothetical protein